MCLIPCAPSSQVRRSTAVLSWGPGVFHDRDSKWCPPSTPLPHSHTHSRAGHTPHVFWLVQCEVDLVDLPSGDGVWGYEEADSCKSRRGHGLWLTETRYPRNYPRPTSFLFSHPCLGTEVLQGLPYCPTTHTDTTLSQGDSKNI